MKSRDEKSVVRSPERVAGSQWGVGLISFNTGIGCRRRERAVCPAGALKPVSSNLQWAIIRYYPNENDVVKHKRAVVRLWVSYRSLRGYPGRPAAKKVSNKRLSPRDADTSVQPSGAGVGLSECVKLRETSNRLRHRAMTSVHRHCPEQGKSS